MKGKHTPGPWCHGKPSWVCLAEGATPVIYVYRGMDESRVAIYGDNMEEDACLIAAAPDLLEACKAAVRAIETDGGPCEPDDENPEVCPLCKAYGQLSAAIAKAKGES